MRNAVVAIPCLLLAGCLARGPFVWGAQYMNEAQDQEFRLGPGDVISVTVATQQGVNARARVREDGRLSLPLVHEVEAAGRTVPELRAELAERFKAYFNKPVVSISVEEIEPLAVSVVGEVHRPGVYPLARNAGVLQAIASAGGLTDYAGRDAIYVVRQEKEPVRIRFTYEALANGHRDASFRLRRNDVVVIE